SEEHTSELQSLTNLVCRLLLEKKKTITHLNLKKALVTWALYRYSSRETRRRTNSTCGLPTAVRLKQLLPSCYSTDSREPTRLHSYTAHRLASRYRLPFPLS